MARHALLVAILLSLIAVSSAHADGDPASDYLLGQPSFVPPDAGVPPAYASQLNDVLRESKIRGYEIRVALIATRYDMGSVGVLYRHPKRYARFLGQELAFVYKGNLLVVMPNGLGFSRAGKPVPADQAVVGRLPPPGTGGVALASTATRAVALLAAHAGVVVPIPPLSGSTRVANPNQDRLVIVIATVVALGGLALFLLFWRWFRGRRPAQPDAG